MNKLNTVHDIKIIKFHKIKSRKVIINVFPNVDNFFKVKRIFTVSGNFNIKSKERGHHAHKNCEQIISCPYGEIKFKVFDGKNSKIFRIKNNDKAIYVPNHIWTETTYLNAKTILICYCSKNYNEKSYIRDMDKYLKFRLLG